MANIKITFLFLLVTGFALVTSCSKDEMLDRAKESGMVQFRLYKKDLLEQKSTAKLDKLSDAKKIQVSLLDETNNAIVQSLKLEAYDEASAEYGLTSEKLALLEGSYKLTGFSLYNAKNEEIQRDEPDSTVKFLVFPEGLTKQIVSIDAAIHGKVQFYLQKDIIAQAKTEVRGEAEFPLRLVKEVDLTLKNIQTRRETVLEDLAVTYLEGFNDTVADTPLSSEAKIDSIINLPAGSYQVIKYVLTNKGGSTVYANSSAVADNQFTIDSYDVIDADVPIRIAEVAEHIQDYIALHAIWEALDGENWAFMGDNYPRGTNWNFNKDMDMWGEQPGVTMNSFGRITGITIGGFGPRGFVPDEIGQLSELNTLILGQLKDMNGNFEPSTELSAKNTAYFADEQQGKFVGNEFYFDNFVRINPRAYFSDITQRAIAESKNEPFQLAQMELPDLTPKAGVLTNYITGISEEIGKLTKLKEISIGNSPISKIPEALADLPNLTDVQVANCPNLTTFPDVLTRLDELVSLNVALNPQMAGDELLRGLDKMATYEGQKETKTIQLLYLSYNKLTTLPESFNQLERLGGLDCSNNEIETIPALGQKVSPVILYFNNNKIHAIQTDENGDYCNMEDVDEIIFSNNKLTRYPDIFTSEALYPVATIDLSYNQIGDIETDRGVYAETLILAGNKLTTFPSSFFDCGSTITYLNLTANQISKFPEKPLDGKNVYMMTTLDLTRNHLTELPSDFNNRKLPYLTGLDLSYNRFESFPYAPFNISSLSVFGIRHQHNADGYRCLREFPASLYVHKGLRALWLGGNDMGKVTAPIPIGPYLNMLDVSDNPNLILDVSVMCARITNNTFMLVYDSTQNISGCSALDLE